MSDLKATVTAARRTRQQRAVSMKTERDAAILDAAIKLATDDHFQFITREKVAAAAGVSVGSVNNAFGRMVELKRAVLKAAVARGIVEIVAQGIAERHPITADAPEDLKQRALAHIAA